MALPDLVLSRSFDGTPSSTAAFNISRISPAVSYLELPEKINGGGAYEIICSGNGLLCFAGFENSEFVIWNLSTDTCRLIPHSDLTYLPCVCASRGCAGTIVFCSASGLAFVADDDYKFVRFMCISYTIDYRRPHNTSLHVAVYSSNDNSWRELPFPFGFEEEHIISPRGMNNVATCVNGFFYWTTSVDVILSFDLSSDTFSTIPFPDDMARDFSPFDAFLLELDGSLGLVIKFEMNTKLFSFWVYQGGGWTRKINLDVWDCDRNVIQPLWLGKKNNGDYSLLLHGYHGPFIPVNEWSFSCGGRRLDALLEYDYTRREFKKIDLIHDDHHTKMMTISPYYNVVKTNIKISNCGCGVDRISPLPDDILLTILSFLSLKEAAASTCLLSKRWSDLWRHAPCLNFDFAHHLCLRDRDRHKYIECVNSVVELCRAPALKELNISFPLKQSTRRTISKWLEFAFSRRVEVMELNFLGLRKSEELLRRFKSTNLRSLCLKCLEVSGEAIGLVLRNCPLLERLIVKYAVLTSDVEVCSGSLKHLHIHNCTGGVSIKGYAPNLTHLKIDSQPLVIIIPRPNVVRYPPLVWSHPPSFCFISTQLTTLEFTIKGYLEKGFPEMPSLRVLIVTYHKRRHNILPITSLLRALPNLEEFEIKHFRMSLIERQQQQQSMGGVINSVCHRHRHLRVFKLTWFDVSDGDHMDLVSYILENCVALHKIILDIYEADTPAASSCCAAALEYAKQLQSELPTHIHLIITFNYRRLV